MKRKTCKSPDCINPVWARGRCLNCDRKAEPHRYEIKRSKPKSALSSQPSEKASKNPPCKSNSKPIAKISEKQKRRLVKYRINREQYFLKQPNCERCGSNKDRDLHHKKGKVGNLLFDKRYFMTSCRSCHEWIHRNDAEARKEGWLLSRLDKFK